LVNPNRAGLDYHNKSKLAKMSKRSMPEHTPTEESSNAGSTPTITATASTQLDDSQAGSGFNPNSEQFDFVREQDRLLPIANVARIMKQAIPVNAKIAKDAKETVQECVSELISFVTSEYACFSSANQSQFFFNVVEPRKGVSKRNGKQSMATILSGPLKLSDSNNMLI
jgi:hypothetical protein